MAEYHYNYTGPSRGQRNDRGNNDLGYWIFTIIMLTAVPPVGVLLLIVKLFGGSGSRRGRHPYNAQRTQQSPGAYTTSYNSQAAYPSQPAASVPGSVSQAPACAKTETTSKKQTGRSSKKQSAQSKLDQLLNTSKTLTIVGAVLTAIFGFVSLMQFSEMFSGMVGGWFHWYMVEELIPILCFLGGGAGLLGCGLHKKKKVRRFRKYLSLIGKRKKISISALAEAMPASRATVRKDLEEMLDSGLFPAGYLDYGDDELVLTDMGLEDDEPQVQQPPQTRAADPKAEEDSILAEIRAVNDAIAHPELSAQIDRIEEITARIFEYQKSHPDKASQLRSFLNYYLPTTLKILHAYARLESQGVEGENITAAKARIEDMMSKVVEGFEKQLDQLFHDDVMDITSDVAVLERMLNKDGLSSSGGLQMGI